MAQEEGIEAQTPQDAQEDALAAKKVVRRIANLRRSERERMPGGEVSHLASTASLY
jgi:hypothetical protein